MWFANGSISKLEVHNRSSCNWPSNLSPPVIPPNVNVPELAKLAASDAVTVAIIYPYLDFLAISSKLDPDTLNIVFIQSPL